MQLRLIRFDRLILLLVSLLYVEASEKLSRVAALAPSPIAMPFQQVSSSSWINDEKVFESPEIHGSLVQKDPERRWTQHRRDTRKGPGGKTITKTPTSSPHHSATLLAEKLAQDALRSKEMQDTIKELSSLDGDHKKHHETSTEAQPVFKPTATSHSATHAAKTTVKSKGHVGHKGQANRKHNGHRKQGLKHRQRKRRLKRHRSKKEFSKTARKRKSRKSISRGRRRGLKGKCSSEKSVTCRRKRRDQIAKTRKKLDRISGENLLQPFMNENQNLIDELPNFESTHKKYRGIPISRQNDKKSDLAHEKRSHIIAELMLTTTPDPTKKKPGDQGVEYSEYYSDNDNILLPDISIQSKLNEIAKAIVGGKVRSVRDTADEDFLDQQYYDPSNELEDDGERAKRNDQKLLKVMEEPSNSMEYVDNTYGPGQANGVVDNGKMSDYLPIYNYIPDQGAQRQGDAYHVMGNPAAEVAGPRRPTSNQFSPDALRIVNQNPPIIGSFPNEAPSNIIPLISAKLNADPIVNNVQSVAPGHPDLPGNVVLSQLPQPRFAEGNLPYYSVSEMPLAHTTGSLTSPVGPSISPSPGKPREDFSDIPVSVPDSRNPLKPYIATAGVSSSSFSALNPTPSYDSSAANSRFSGSETPGTGSSATPSSPKASLTTFRMTPSPTDISSASLDSPESFSGLREIRPEVNAPEVGHFRDSDGADDTWGPDQIEPIASRDIAVEDSPVKKGKKKGTAPKKTDGHASSTTVSEMNATKEHGSSKATTGVDYNLLPMTCQSSVITIGSSSPEPANTTTITNEIKAVANETKTVGNGTKAFANETKAVANEILNEIIEEIEELRLENPKDEQKEGLPCRLTGSWVTARAGVRIDMQVTNHSVRVSLDHLTSPITTEAILNVTWNVTGFAPFKRGGPFTLLATNNHTKTLAVFVGACKVCQGIDTIEGSWIVSREPRDCRDFQMSTNIFNEIFRRTRLYSAIKDKQSKHETQGSSTTVSASANSSTSESTSTVHELPDNYGKFHNQSSEFNRTE